MKLVKLAIIVALTAMLIAVWTFGAIAIPAKARSAFGQREICAEYGNIGEDVIIVRGQCWVKPE